MAARAPPASMGAARHDLQPARGEVDRVAQVAGLRVLAEAGAGAEGEQLRDSAVAGRRRAARGACRVVDAERRGRWRGRGGRRRRGSALRAVRAQHDRDPVVARCRRATIETLGSSASTARRPSARRSSKRAMATVIGGRVCMGRRPHRPIAVIGTGRRVNRPHPCLTPPPPPGSPPWERKPPGACVSLPHCPSPASSSPCCCRRPRPPGDVRRGATKGDRSSPPTVRRRRRRPLLGRGALRGQVTIFAQQPLPPASARDTDAWVTFDLAAGRQQPRRACEHLHELHDRLRALALAHPRQHARGLGHALLMMTHEFGHLLGTRMSRARQRDGAGVHRLLRRAAALQGQPAPARPAQHVALGDPERHAAPMRLREPGDGPVLSRMQPCDAAVPSVPGEIAGAVQRDLAWAALELLEDVGPAAGRQRKRAAGGRAERARRPPRRRSGRVASG